MLTVGTKRGLPVVTAETAGDDDVGVIGVVGVVGVVGVGSDDIQLLNGVWIKLCQCKS